MKIYVMTHKPFVTPKEEIYIPLHVGREISKDLGYPGDNTGENISELNPYFGELTGFYWIWQNDKDSDYIGICHYRRFYLNDEGNIMDEAAFRNILGRYDCITSDLLVSKKNNYEGYISSHNEKDLHILKNSLIQLYPKYESSYDDYMADYSSCYSNLCVMPRDMYQDYCNWLFSILFHASETIDVSDYDLYHKRIYGFLSEMLLDIYIRHNRYNVYRNPVGTFGDKAETNELISAVGILVGEGKYKEARGLCEDIINIRPDIMLPMSDSKRRVPIVQHITCILDLENQAGYEGMISVSNDMGKLIEYYRCVHRILSSEISEENIDYLLNSKFSPYMAMVMIVNDIARGIDENPIDRDRAVENLKRVFYNDEYALFEKLINSL